MSTPCYFARFVVTATLGMFAAPNVSAEENRPDGECDLQLRVEFSETDVEAFAPILAKVELSNTGSRPRTVAVRGDGCPYGLSFVTVDHDGNEAEHSLWLTRNGPQHNDIVLKPGDATTGEVLVLLTYGDDMVFTSPGRYATRWSWRSPECSMVWSANADVNVVRPSAASAALLGAIERAALDHFVEEPEPTIDWDDPQLRRAIRQQATPLLGRIILDRIPQSDLAVSGELNVRDKSLVESLASAVKAHPEAALAPYVARFLGRLQCKTFERVVSRSGIEHWDAREVPNELDPAYVQARKAREQALHYLTLASQHDLWPRTAALYQLGRLHVMSEEWDEVEACTAKLRAMGTGNANKVADRVEGEAARYRQKLVQRKAREDD